MEVSDKTAKTLKFQEDFLEDVTQKSSLDKRAVYDEN